MVVSSKEEESKMVAALSPGAIDLVAARFKLLGEPMRLRLLQALHNSELNVTQLVETTGATQANVSKHLGLLCDAGILRRRKDGMRVFYTIADPRPGATRQF